MSHEVRIIWSVIIAVFGLLIGSFLNVCIYRLPRNKSTLSPRRSYCPACHEPIAWYDNIPVVSYLALARMCRRCGSLISPRYMIVELLTAATLTLMFNVLQARGESPGVIAIYSATVCVLIVAASIDIELRIIPDEITIGGMLFAPALCMIFASGHIHDFPEYGRALVLSRDPLWGALAASLTGMAVGAGAIFLSGALGKIAFRREAMGLGDVKFMAFLGAVLGWKLILFTFFLAPILGVAVGAVRLIRGGDRQIPYAPFLSLAAVIVMLAGRQLTELIGLAGLFYPYA